MGQYWEIYNIDSSEVLSPTMVNCSAKLTEELMAGVVGTPDAPRIGGVLWSLLEGAWSGDRLVAIGDYAELAKDAPLVDEVMYRSASCVDVGDVVRDMDFTASRFADSPLVIVARSADNIVEYITSPGLGDRTQRDVAKGEGFWQCYGNVLSALVMLLAVSNGRGGGDFREETLPGRWGAWSITAHAKEPGGGTCIDSQVRQAFLVDEPKIAERYAGLR